MSISKTAFQAPPSHSPRQTQWGGTTLNGLTVSLSLLLCLKSKSCPHVGILLQRGRKTSMKIQVPWSIKERVAVNGIRGTFSENLLVIINLPNDFVQRKRSRQNAEGKGKTRQVEFYVWSYFTKLFSHIYWKQTYKAQQELKLLVIETLVVTAFNFPLLGLDELQFLQETWWLFISFILCWFGDKLS